MTLTLKPNTADTVPHTRQLNLLHPKLPQALIPSAPQSLPCLALLKGELVLVLHCRRDRRTVQVGDLAMWGPYALGLEGLGF